MIRPRRVIAWGPRCYNTSPSNSTGDGQTQSAVRSWRRNDRFSRVASGQLISRSGPVGYDHFETSRFGIVGIPVECYKFVQGATSYRYTSADQTIALAQVDVGSYPPEAITRGELDFSQEDTAQNLTVTVSKSNAVAQLFRAGVPSGKVAAFIYRKHRSDPEEKVLFVGNVVACEFDGMQANLTCAPLANIFMRKVPRVVYQSQCNWALYGAGCEVVKASFKTTGTVLSIDGAAISAAAWAGQPDGWFTNGWAEIAATGERRFIVNHVGSTLYLMNAFSSLSVGASIDAYAGCDRTETACDTKFSNLVKHLGFKRIPTRNPYAGGSLT